MEAPGDAAIDERLAELLAPLGPSERGFVLGLLLSRGQDQREEVATMLPGEVGGRCRAAVRAANLLPREGRLLLIRRLAREALGFRPGSGEGFSVARLRSLLEGESAAILAVLAVLAEPTGGDPLGDAARSILAARGDAGGGRTAGALAHNGLRVELRRAVIARLDAPPASPTSAPAPHRGT